MGLVIGAAETRAVAVERDVVVWSHSVPLSGETTLQEAVGSLLDAAPTGRARSAGLFAALGPSYAQLKALAGLPDAGDMHALSAVVQANTAALFLVGCGPVVPTSVRRHADGSVWGAALDRDAMRAIEQACARARIRLHGVTPAIAAVTAGAVDGTHAWCDDEVRLEAGVSGGHLLRLARTREGRNSLAVLPSITSVDVGQMVAASRAADAFMWRPEADERRKRTRRTRTYALTGTVVLTALCAVLAPTIRLLRAADATRPPRPGPQSSAFQPTRRELSRVSHELEQIQQFVAKRRSAVRLLASITAVLPESTAIVSLRVDSVGGTFTALAPHIADVIPALAAADDVTAPRLAGAVTREVMAGALLERAAIRFRFVGVPLQGVARGASAVPGSGAAQ